MKHKVFFLVLFSLILHQTSQQLALPFQLHQSDQKQIFQSSRHHFLGKAKPLSHKKTIKHFHNLQYIKDHYQSESYHQKSRSHQLKSQHDEDHLKIQTFNLNAHAYSFTLTMKIAGLNYKMGIDSGSSDIFIKGQNSQGKPQKKYQCGQKCIHNNDLYMIGYLDGHLDTYETNLQVELGQHKFNESILVAYRVDRNFKENQGLIGLSFPELASNPNPTFLQTLKNLQIISQYAFGVNLNFQNNTRCFITFGSFDNQFFIGSLDYYPLTSNMFYYIQSQGVSIGKSQLMTMKTALLDTGNTCISIPKKYVDQILKQFNQGSGHQENACFFQKEIHAEMFSVLRCKVGNFSALPIVNIHLGDKVYPIEKQFYLQACDRRPNQQSSSSNPSQGIWYCDTYIESVSGMHELFLGDGFFNRYYTFFDLENKKVGIAKNKEVIKMEKIIQNQLDADQQDWEIILTELNKNESKSDIKQEINKALGELKNKKDEDNDSSSQSS